MAEISLNINSQTYEMECDDGQESRVIALGDYVEAKLQPIREAGAASSDNHLLVLTCLMLTDEIFELRETMRNLDGQVQDEEARKRDEQFIAESISQLAARIDTLATRAQRAI